MTPTPTPPAEGEDDESMRLLWLGAGGSFHGPRVETGTMPEAKLLPFLRSLRAAQPQGEDESGKAWLFDKYAEATARAVEAENRAERAEDRAKGLDEYVLGILRGVVEAAGESWSEWSEASWQEIVALAQPHDDAAGNGSLAIYRENGDTFLVRAVEKSDAEYVRYSMHILHIIDEDPNHMVRYHAGDSLDVLRHRSVAAGSAYGCNWTIAMVAANATRGGGRE